MIGLILSVGAIGCGGAGRPQGARVAETSAAGRSSCLGRQGIELGPEASSLDSLLRNGGIVPPRGATADELEAALRKCGYPRLPVAGVAGEARKLQGTIRQFGRCLRQHGATVSKPDFSGVVPVMRVSVPARLPRQALERECAAHAVNRKGVEPGEQSTITVGSSQ
jgi:hypothetical protein